MIWRWDCGVCKPNQEHMLAKEGWSVRFSGLFGEAGEAGL